MEPLNETITVNRLDYEALEASLAIAEEHAVRQEKRIHELEAKVEWLTRALAGLTLDA